MTGVEDLLRQLAPQVLGALVRHHPGQFDACEDAVQEALLAAAGRWPDDGVPNSPRGWLITAEIARPYLVAEATLAQRISRAKQRMKATGAVFSMPPEAERAERLAVVLHVLYLVFNEGYTATSGPDLQRTDLTREAIR